METYIALTLCLFVPALGMLVGHWFPWKLAIGRMLTRIEAYVYGTVWMVTPPMIIMATQGQTFYAVLLGLAVIGAGSATLTAYAVDGWIDTRHKHMDLQDKLNHADTWNTEPTD